MRPRKVGILLVLCAVLAIFSCSDKTLRKFFDGVPQRKSKNVPVAPQKIDTGEHLPTTGSQHAPYAAKECDSCHDKAKGNSLVVPKEQLCFTCHDFPMNKKYVHGPLAGGGCLLCHDPHSSRFPKLLVAESGTFCFYCHDPASIPKDEPHARKDVQCISCHDAHMSDKKYLLK